MADDRLEHGGMTSGTASLSDGTATLVGGRRRLSAARRAPPPAPPVTLSGHGPRWVWLKALVGGTLLGSLLFALLGYIQPVFQRDERIEIPSVVKLLLEDGLTQEKSKTLVKKPESQREEARAESRPRPRPANLKRVTQETQQQPAQTRRPELSLLQGASMFTSFGAAAAGATSLQIDFSSDDQEAAQKAREFRSWEERRRRIREGEDDRRSRGGSAMASGGGVSSMKVNMTAAEASYLPPPKYPPKALKEQVEGFVRVRLLISITGTVEKFEIRAAQPAGYFEDSIKEALPKWRFTPAVNEAGLPIEFWEEYTYQFRLEDAAT